MADIIGLEHVEAQHSGDPAKIDMELVCTECDEVLCDIEHGDTFTVLVGVVQDHNREAGHLQ